MELGELDAVELRQLPSKRCNLAGSVGEVVDPGEEGAAEGYSWAGVQRDFCSWLIGYKI